MNLISRLAKIFYQALVVGGAIVSLVTFGILFGDDIYRFIEPHFPIVIIVTIIAGLAACYLALIAFASILLLRLMRKLMERRENMRRLNDLSLDIVYLKQLIDERQTHFQGSESELGFYIDEVIERQSALTGHLTALDVPTPEIATDSSYVRELVVWQIYLDNLLPIAVSRDIDSARALMAQVDSGEENRLCMVTPSGGALWFGASGRTYSYFVNEGELVGNWRDSPGNYIFARRAPGGWRPVYIGETESLKAEITDSHPRLLCARQEGFTHIHAHIGSEDTDARRREVEDILLRGEAPCNRQQSPS